MANRLGRKPAKKAATKRPPTPLAEVAKNVSFQSTSCCGLIEASGMNSVKTPAHARALIRLVKGKTKGPYGYVICTTNNYQRDAADVLERGGFSRLAEFHNPNSDNDVTLWGAATNAGE